MDLNIKHKAIKLLEKSKGDDLWDPDQEKNSQT